MFRIVPLSTIRRFSLYAQQWYMSYRFADSLRTGSGRNYSSRGGARFSAPVRRTGPGDHPASYTMGTGSFRGVKRPGRGVDHPPHLVPRVKERAELYLYSPPRAFMACSRVNFTFTLRLMMNVFDRNIVLTYSTLQSPS